MKKQRIISAFLALVLTLSLIPAGFALERSELTVNPECGTYRINEKGQYIFELTYPDDQTPQPRPFLNVEMPSMSSQSGGDVIGLCYSGPDKGKLYGIKPGKATFRFSARYINELTEDYDAILNITVVPADTYYTINPKPGNPDSTTPEEPEPQPAVTPIPAPSAQPSPEPTIPGTSAHTHQYETKITKAPTCKSTGISQEVCSVCGAVRSGSTRTVSKATDHTWEDKTTPASCTREGKSWQQCSVCGKTQNVKTIPKSEHNYVEGTIVRQPTVTSTGERLDRCSVCNAAKYVELPKKEEAPLGPHISGSYAMPKLSQEEIKQLLKANSTALPTADIYDVLPSCSAPYSPGRVKTSVLQATTDRLNALRKLSGLPAVKLDLALCESAQYAAVINAATGVMSHTPTKPADMDADFFQKASSAAGSSNLYSGGDLPSRVDGWMDDSGGNESSVGHRRWQLNPGMGKVGFGTASRSGRSGGPSAEKVFDNSAPGFDYDFIGWPASGNFPGDLFWRDVAWSITLNPEKYQTPSQSQVKVTLTRQSDGKSWVFSGGGYQAGGSGPYFNVDTSGYGVKNCIIFRPDGVQKYEGTYTVKIDGLKTLGGKSVTDFQYQVEFFDLEPVSQQKPDATEKPETAGKPAAGTSGTTPSGTPAFADVPSNQWYYDSIQQAYADGVIDGTSYNDATGVRMFSPYDTLTLAEFTAIVTRAFYSGEIGRRDSSQPWYTPNVAVADRHGLLQGVGTRNMNSPASRFQMAQIMLNILEDQGESALSAAAIGQAAGQISDWSKVNSSYRTAVATCYSLGLLRGNDSSGTFNGAASMQRCECATVYIRLRDHFKGQSTQPAQPDQPSQTTGDAEDYSESYKSGKYYKALKDVTLTGDYRRDVIAVAASQLGYCESNSKDQLDGTRPGGGNFTEYGRFMGTNGTAWCSEFASWCLRQAKVPISLVQSSPSANIKTFAAPYHPWSDTVYAGGNYTPQAGDLVLFAWNGTSHTQANLSHTGIVESVNWDGRNLVIHTIEGNANDNVMRCERRVTDPARGVLYEGDIVYFVAPNY